jgi:thioesterase domain-containing protein
VPKDASAGKQDGGAKLFRNISKFDLAEEAKSAIAKIAANNSGRVIESLAPGRFRGDIMLFEATLGKQDSAPTAQSWEPHTDAKVEAHQIGCEHRDITSAGPLAEIGHLIAENLEEITPAPAGASS